MNNFLLLNVRELYLLYIYIYICRVFCPQLYDILSIPFKYKYDILSIPIKYKYDILSIPFKYKYDILSIPIKYK